MNGKFTNGIIVLLLLMLVPTIVFADIPESAGYGVLALIIFMVLTPVFALFVFIVNLNVLIRRESKQTKRCIWLNVISSLILLSHFFRRSIGRKLIAHCMELSESRINT